MIMCCHVPQQNDDARTSQHGRNRSCIGPKKCTDYCADQGSAGIEMLDKDIWSLAGKNIPHQAAADSCEHAHEGLQEQVALGGGVLRHKNTRHGKQPQSHRIHDQQQPFLEQRPAAGRGANRPQEKNHTDDHGCDREDGISESGWRGDVEDQVP